MLSNVRVIGNSSANDNSDSSSSTNDSFEDISEKLIEDLEDRIFELNQEVYILDKAALTIVMKLLIQLSAYVDDNHSSVSSANECTSLPLAEDVDLRCTKPLADTGNSETYDQVFQRMIDSADSLAANIFGRVVSSQISLTKVFYLSTSSMK
ncbi:unnamed protein product [Rhizopus stolonifer]